MKAPTHQSTVKPVTTKTKLTEGESQTLKKKLKTTTTETASTGNTTKPTGGERQTLTKKLKLLGLTTQPRQQREKDLKPLHETTSYFMHKS